MNVPRPRDRRYSGEQGERGSVLVEMVAVAGLLVLLCFGLIEMGMAWKNRTEANVASRHAARVISMLGSDADADHHALQAALAGIDPDQRDNLEAIVIFRPNTEGTWDPSCETASGPTCNRFEPSHLADLDDDTKWACDFLAHDLSWCPTSRGKELVGVMIRSRHEWITGVFPGDGLVFDAVTIMEIH